MIHYLLVGVYRYPASSPEDGDSYKPISINVPSKTVLTVKELEKAFATSVDALWNDVLKNLEDDQELKDWLDGSGYKNLDYILTSTDPFPEEVLVYGTDLVNNYLGS